MQPSDPHARPLSGSAERCGPGVDRIFGTCSEHGDYELPLGSIDSGELMRGCPGCATRPEKPKAAAAAARASSLPDR